MSDPTLEQKIETGFMALLKSSPPIAARGILPNDGESDKDTQLVVSAICKEQSPERSLNWKTEVTITAKSRVKRDGEGPGALDALGAEILDALGTRYDDKSTLAQRLTNSVPSLDVGWATGPDSIDRSPSGNYNTRTYTFNIIARNS